MASSAPGASVSTQLQVMCISTAASFMGNVTLVDEAGSNDDFIWSPKHTTSVNSSPTGQTLQCSWSSRHELDYKYCLNNLTFCVSSLANV